jgi:hypothetical protein
VPDVDCVIHAGDEANPANPLLNYIHARDFLEWWSAIDLPKYFCPGNHSTAVSHGAIVYPGMVINESVDIGGLNAYFSPYTPAWGDSWAFMVRRNRIGVAWDMIPDNTDILVTHGPPKGVLDITRDRDSGHLIQVGCSALRKRVRAIKPKLHVFGHIHDERGISNYGIYERDGVRYVNCSVCDIKGNWKHEGIIVEV